MKASKLLRLIHRIDGDTTTEGEPFASKGKHWIKSFVAVAAKQDSPRGRLYRAALDGDPDPEDLAHRAGRGANAALANAASMPDVDEMDLAEAKSVAASMGAYTSSVRAKLAPAILDRLRTLGASQLADLYDRLWTAEGGLDLPSDDEANRAGAAHGDADEDEASAALKRANRELLASKPRGRSRR